MFSLIDYIYIRCLIEQDIADSTRLNLPQLLSQPQSIKHKLDIIIGVLKDEN